MGGPTTEPWHEPSVVNVALETARRGLNTSGPLRWRDAVLTIALIVAFALVMPKVGSETWNVGVLGAPVLITITLAYRAGRRQQALGRGRSRSVTAVAVTVLGAFGFAALLVGTSLLIGPAEEDALFTRFLEALDRGRMRSLFLVAFFVGLGVLVVLGYVRGKPGRLAEEAVLEEEARIERAARAAASGKE